MLLVLFYLLAGAIIIGLSFIILAQMLRLFVDMEENQRKNNDLLEQIIKYLPEQKVWFLNSQLENL